MTTSAPRFSVTLLTLSGVSGGQSFETFDSALGALGRGTGVDAVGGIYEVRGKGKKTRSELVFVFAPLGGASARLVGACMSRGDTASQRIARALVQS